MGLAWSFVYQIPSDTYVFNRFITNNYLILKSQKESDIYLIRFWLTMDLAKIFLFYFCSLILNNQGLALGEFFVIDYFFWTFQVNVKCHQDVIADSCLTKKMLVPQPRNWLKSFFQDTWHIRGLWNSCKKSEADKSMFLKKTIFM